MRIYKRRLSPNLQTKAGNLLFLLTLVILAAGCGDEEKDDIAAKINNSVLSRAELLHKTGPSAENNTKYAEEYTREWVEKNLLFLEAKEQGILEDSTFMDITEESYIRLAGALFLKKHFENIKIENEENSVRSFYEENREDYKLNTRAAVFNMAEFGSLENAVRFKDLVYRGGWENAAEAMSDSIFILHDNEYKLLNEVHPVKLQRILSELMPREISIAIQTEQNRFVIVQLTKRFSPGDIPGFEYIKEVVSARYKAVKSREVYNNLIERLFTKYNVEIHRK